MKISRGEKKLAVICTLALAIPLAVAAFIGHINATPIIVATAPANAPNPNGYDLTVQASNLIRPANPAVDSNLDTKWIKDPKVRAQRYSLKRKDAWLAQNRTGFALFEQAQKTPSLAPAYSTANGKAIRQMARYKVIESNAHWQRGEHNRALQSGLDIIQLYHDVQRGGGADDILLGSAIGGMSRRATEDTIEHLSANQARLAARRLEKLLSKRWLLHQALNKDRILIQRDWLAYFEQPDWRGSFIALRAQNSVRFPNWAPATLTWKERLFVRTVSKRQIMADVDAVYQRGIANARASYATETPSPLANPLVSYLAETLTRIRFSDTRDKTADRVLLLRLSLRAYQLEHNAPPPNLGALVPDYIRAVPHDPFGKGAPFRYQSDGVNYKLWSLGPDGKDDGGTSIPWPSAKSKQANRKRYADEREKLPQIWWDGAVGDYVAGKNHGKH